ncbi:MAG: alpha/beta fold hydrolase [Anaerolineae bacterium]|jgi:uncharacterized protein|nr:alpha/beta fold hydrolase [Anaerolineae bacterium]MBT7073318.1 alpha/beta fold hydrolase [Anaerolineae bacterium]MBT7782225.1 alpha/beta fold hydrolase [Anaerolineae bacterium]
MKPWLLIFIFLLVACAPAPAQTPLPTEAVASPPPLTNTPFQPVSVTETPTPIPTFTPTPFITNTPDPLWKYTIPAMRERSYGGGDIQILEQIDETETFKRYKFLYPSDGLNIYGFVNIPKGKGPFPVMIVIHGNYDISNYNLTPFTRYDADILSREGYLVLHPNMRNFGESDKGDDLYRTGLATDILNLIAIIKTQGVKLNELEQAVPQKVGLWGHSMGGEVALRVITVSNDIQATVLYAPMTGDMIKNAQYLNLTEELNTPAHLIPAISPHISYYHITSPLKLYHGTSDAAIPVEYSRETCELLTNLGKEINCAFYEGAEHTFNGIYEPDFQKSFLYFLESHLQSP